MAHKITGVLYFLEGHHQIRHEGVRVRIADAFGPTQDGVNRFDTKPILIFKSHGDPRLITAAVRDAVPSLNGEIATAPVMPMGRLVAEITAG